MGKFQIYFDENFWNDYRITYHTLQYIAVVGSLLPPTVCSWAIRYKNVPQIIAEYATKDFETIKYRKGFQNRIQKTLILSERSAKFGNLIVEGAKPQQSLKPQPQNENKNFQKLHFNF